MSAPGNPVTLGPPYDYVIITTNDIVDNSDRLEHFVYMKELNGHDVLVVTEDDIDPIVADAPNGRADKIRKWLVDNEGPLGIEYVLLIGDPDPDDPTDPADEVGDIPMKMTMYGYFSWHYRDMPTDMFYADLDGDWDLDDDGYYGEYMSSTNPESPDPTINDDYFSARWTGYIHCDFTEEYEFHTFTDGGVKVWVDGDLIIDNWDPMTEHLPTSDMQTKAMTAGDNDIVVEYKEHTGDGIMHLMWRTTAAQGDPTYLAREIIPLDHLRDETDSADGLTGRFYNNVDLTGSPDLVRPDGEVLDYSWGTGDLGPNGPENDGDVYVGRIPVYDDDYDELDSILGKMIQYETDPGDISWRESILLPVYPLTDTTPAYHYPEAILADYAIAAGFSYYRIYKEDYAPSGPTPELWPTTANAVRDEWMNGYGVVTWWTHGYETGASSVFTSGRADEGVVGLARQLDVRPDLGQESQLRLHLQQGHNTGRLASGQITCRGEETHRNRIMERAELQPVRRPRDLSVDDVPELPACRGRERTIRDGRGHGGHVRRLRLVRSRGRSARIPVGY
jgi:hypothetical protein